MVHFNQVFFLGTNSTEIDYNVTIVESEIVVSSDAFDDMDSSYVLNLYSSATLFPILRPSDDNTSDFENITVDSEVIGFNVVGNKSLTNISVIITLQSLEGRIGGKVSLFYHFRGVVAGIYAHSLLSIIGCVRSCLCLMGLQLYKRGSVNDSFGSMLLIIASFQEIQLEAIGPRRAAICQILIVIL